MTDQNPPETPVIFACSPRQGGNSDVAADLLSRGLREGGLEGRILHLRDYTVLPCTGCLGCDKDRDGCCVLEGKDQARTLFSELFRAPVVFFTSPIYFYHLPAQFKSFIDRGQSYWIRREKKDQQMTGLPHRQAIAVLQAGRPRGERLFEGSLLTLRYFLKPFNLDMVEPLLFRGKDGPRDLLSDHESCLAIAARARIVAEGLIGQH